MSRASSARSIEIQICGTASSLHTKCSKRQESVRDILVPCYNPKVYRTLWKPNELRRIKTASRIVSKEERERNAEKFEAERNRLEWECEQRKRFMREMDKAKEIAATKWKIAQSDSENEEETKEKLKNRIFLAQHEGIAEVQKANRLILAAKCHVVQDAQINEKHELQRAERAMALELERKMLIENEKALRKENERKERMKSLQEKYAIELQRQQEARQLKKEMEARQVKAEAESVARMREAIERDEKAKQQAKHDEIKRKREDFLKSCELNKYFREKAYEEQRIAEMKAQEYQRLRRERELQLEKEKRLAAERKQREIDRILALQMKFQQLKGEQESLSMRRIQEEKEREFRRKEKEKAMKRKELEQQVVQTRDAQISAMKRNRESEEMLAKIQHEQIVEKIRETEKAEAEAKKKMHFLKEQYRNGKQFKYK